MIKAKEVWSMSAEEIQERIRQEEEELHQLHFQHAIAQLENPMILREKRRLIARLKTVLNNREAEG